MAAGELTPLLPRKREDAPAEEATTGLQTIAQPFHASLELPPRLGCGLFGIVLAGAALVSVLWTSPRSSFLSRTHNAERNFSSEAGGVETLLSKTSQHTTPLDIGDSGRDASKGFDPRRASLGDSGVNSTGNDNTSSPNVIFILIDDVGMNDVGLLSTDLMKLTPFMDSLALGGVRLNKYYSNEICTPARVSCSFLLFILVCVFNLETGGGFTTVGLNKLLLSWLTVANTVGFNSSVRFVYQASTRYYFWSYR